MEPVDYNTLQQWERKIIRERYAVEQNELCYHCGEPLSGEPSEEVRNMTIHEYLFPEGFLNNPVHLHHDHDTGLTIGAVHARCNAVLWQYYKE